MTMCGDEVGRRFNPPAGPRQPRAGRAGKKK